MANVYRRGKVWWIRFQAAGREVRRSSGSGSKADALQFLADQHKEARRVARGGAPRHNLDETLARFIHEHLPAMRPSAADRYRRSISDILRHTNDGALFLHDLGADALSGYVAARRSDGVSDTTVRRDLACLSSALSCAVDWGWLPVNPMRAWRRRSLKRETSRTRFLTREQFTKLLRHAGSIRPIIIIAAETGLRAGEILALNAADIDYQSALIAVRDSKTHTPRMVPMSRAASAQFRAQRAVNGARLFLTRTGRPLAVGEVSKRFRRAAKAAGLSDIRFHDLRHTFASWAVQNGMDLYTLGRLLGHKGPQMTMRYAHLRTADLAKALKSAQKRAQRQGISARKR